jgi:hypothetical protein
MEDNIKTDFKNWIKTWTELKCPKMRYNGGTWRTLQCFITCRTAVQFFSHMTLNYLKKKDKFSVELLCTVRITMSNDNILFTNKDCT